MWIDKFVSIWLVSYVSYWHRFHQIHLSVFKTCSIGKQQHASFRHVSKLTCGRKDASREVAALPDSWLFITYQKLMGRRHSNCLRAFSSNWRWAFWLHLTSAPSWSPQQMFLHSDHWSLGFEALNSFSRNIKIVGHQNNVGSSPLLSMPSFVCLFSPDVM